ncbi:MAG: hypothetical protein UD936_02400 [Acutalibacteraceae bacterium]|nr:hypothetical protein [Acutalibacteraceae bacterium]
MKNKIISAVLIALLALSSAACNNTKTEETAPASPYITASSVIEEYKQQDIAKLLELWAFSYSTHDTLQYNDCVTEELEYPDNSGYNQPYTTNYFDTVTDCKVTDIDFENAKASEDKIYAIPVKYTITYNQHFKEENGLKKGENSLSATMSIQEVSGGYFIICGIENHIEKA